MPTVLSREDILNANDRRTRFVPTPEWAPKDTPEDQLEDFGVYAISLSGAERDAFEMAMIEQRQVSKGGKSKTVQTLNLKNLRAKLVARAAVDHPDPEVAHEIFTPADVDALGEKNANALNRVYRAIRDLSGLSEEDVEELTLDLGEDQNGSSGTVLPSPLASLTSGSSKTESTAGSSPTGWPSTDSSPSETEG